MGNRVKCIPLIPSSLLQLMSKSSWGYNRNVKFHPTHILQRSLFDELWMNSILDSSALLIHKTNTSQSMNKRWFPPGTVSSMLYVAGKMRDASWWRNPQHGSHSSISNSPETQCGSWVSKAMGAQPSSLLPEYFRYLGKIAEPPN